MHKQFTHCFILLLFVCLTPLCFPQKSLSDDQISLSAVQHYWESGHTFIRSDKEDREFDGIGYQIDYTHWWDTIGINVNYCRHHNVDERMFTPNWRYKAKLQTLEFIPELRVPLDELFDFKLGIGLSYSYLENDYNGISETLDGIGWVALLGGDWYFTKNRLFFATMTARYIRNDLASGHYSFTNFRIGGLKCAIGIGINF